MLFLLLVYITFAFYVYNFVSKALHEYSAAEQHLMWAYTYLSETYGTDYSLPCGVTATVVESIHLEFQHQTWTDIQPNRRNTVYRLHFEIDAENISDDHVLFLVPKGDDEVLVLSSYANVHAPKLETQPFFWIHVLKRMVDTQNTELWKSLFTEHNPIISFVDPVSISCHISAAQF